MLNNKNNVIYFGICITPALAMLSGLFMAAWIPSVLIILFLAIRPRIIPTIQNLESTEHMLIVWTIASCFWSISPQESITTAARLVSVLLASHIIIDNANLIKIRRARLFDLLMFGIFLAGVIFLVEKYTEGVLYKIIRSYTQPSKISSFHLYWLDRGVCVLSLSSWPILYMLISSGYKLQAFLLYVIIFAVLLLSDSSAGILAYALAGIAFLFAHSRILSKLLALFFALYIFTMPVFSALQSPEDLAAKYDMPISYVHRLFIWKFTADKSQEIPLEGHGIGASRALSIAHKDHIEYEGHRLHPLPIHPHNNIMQVWLELGTVGLFIAALWVWGSLSKLGAITSEPYRAVSYGVFTNYFVIGMVSFGLWQSWWMMMIPFLVLLMIMVKNSDNSK